jgi:hypothetical protein
MVGSVVLWAGVALAADHVLFGTKLLVRATPAPGKVSFVDREGTTSILPGGADDPSLVGATFKLHEPVSGESIVVDLPASNWTTNPAKNLARFENDDAPAGVSPVRVAVIKGTTVKVKVRTSGLALPAGADAIHVELQAGPSHWCATFQNPKKNEPGLFLAGRQQTTPSSCVDFWVTPTTSTTSTTLAPCGGGPFACGGACDPGLTCAPISDFPPYCGCVPDGSQPCESATQPYCNGTCGGGGTCGATAPFAGSACICVPPGGTACGSAAAPVCGGVCPGSQECQAFDIDTLQFCACTTPGPCGCALPGTCPGDEWCHIDPPCGCAP